MTHPVEGLKPGPLAGQDLSLLKPGDVLSLGGELVVFTGPWTSARGTPGIVHKTTEGNRGSNLVHLYSYIGEQDAEGWIAWTGRENPLGDKVIEASLATGAIVTKRADHFPAVVWSNIIIAFRPVSTKPQGGDQGALQAQAPSVTSEQTEGAVLTPEILLSAKRFDALMRCGRIKMQGSSGVDPHTLERNGNNVHFGAELWPEPIPEGFEEHYGQSTLWGRACLMHLADAILEQEAAIAKGGAS